MPDTKDMRIVLKREQDIEQFNTAKAKAERELGYTLRDNEFAVRVLVQALKQKNEGLGDMQVLVNLLSKDLETGGEFARQYEKTYGIKRRGQ